MIKKALIERGQRVIRAFDLENRFDKFINFIKVYANKQLWSISIDYDSNILKPSSRTKNTKVFVTSLNAGC